MATRIEFNEREQYLLSSIFMDIFGGGSTTVIQSILGKHVANARLLRSKVEAQVKSKDSSFIELTDEEWRVMYESLNAVIYGLGPSELHTITGFTLQEACDVNIQICVAVWDAYDGRTWKESEDFRRKQSVNFTDSNH